MEVIIFPSPHLSIQLLGVLISPSVQFHPDSTLQVELHPSPFIELLSSQYPDVGKVTTPSPQISTQVLAVEMEPPEQAHLGHVLSQPSPVLPSSSNFQLCMCTLSQPSLIQLCR